MNNIPTTRAEAKALGARHYFTGKPCKHGHVALRETKGACVECRRIEHEASYANRKEYFAEYNKSEKGIASKRKYYEANKEVVIAKAANRPIEERRAHRRTWNQENPGAKNALTAKRRSRKKNATPIWLADHHKRKIDQMYVSADKMSKELGQRYQVDHIIPLQSDTVCGLHVPWNLQLLSVEANQSKGNRYDEDAGVAFPNGGGKK